MFSFLFDYKMEVARKLLEAGEYNVNEVGHKVGYSTSSHFIAAFKKKYGTTPKNILWLISLKYLMIRFNTTKIKITLYF